MYQRIHKILVLTFLMAGACLIDQPAEAQEKMHVLKIETVAELHDFFKYSEGDMPIISGHRGGIVEGFPENSIEAMENTLKHTPAFFELDPMLTKDSVIVLMHDVTIDRTTTGTGNISDYTWEELQQFNLVDHLGNVTEYKIPTLAEVIEWSRGKTVINLDRKNVPLHMTAAIIKEHQAEAHVMVTVHSAEQARFYLDNNEDIMFSAFIRTKEEFREYEKEGIPWGQMIAYVGPRSKPENRELYAMLKERGVRPMVSSASSYDKLEDPEERRQAYVKIIQDGAMVLESDLPIEASKAIQSLIPEDSEKLEYYGKIDTW